MNRDVKKIVKEICAYVVEILIVVGGLNIYSCTYIESFSSTYLIAARVVRSVVIFAMIIYIDILKW